MIGKTICPVAGKKNERKKFDPTVGSEDRRKINHAGHTVRSLSKFIGVNITTLSLVINRKKKSEPIRRFLNDLPESLADVDAYGIKARSNR